MDNLGLLADGLAAALTPMNLLYAAVGVLLGTFVGVLPGIGPAMAVAMLLPITYGLDVTQSMIIFAGAAWSLGSRTPLRDVLVGAVLSVGSWYFFYALGVPLTPGILDGIL